MLGLNSKIYKNKIELLDCQVDLILQSLEIYCKYINPSEENSKMALVTDTFEQILSEYNESKKNRNKTPKKNIIKKLA